MCINLCFFCEFFDGGTFKIDENARQVEIFAVFHASRNPKIWLLRTQKKK
jgi:hypothetical protein